MNDLLVARSKEAVAKMVAELPGKVTSLPQTALFFIDGDSVKLEGVDPPANVTLDRFEQWILRSSHLENEQFLVDAEGGLEVVDVPFRGFDFDAIERTRDDGEIDAAFLPAGERAVLGLFAGEQSIEVFTAEIASVIANNVEAVLDRVQRERELRQREQRLSVLSRVLRHNLRNDMNSILAQLQTIEEKVDDQRTESLASSAIDVGWGLVDVSQQARTIEQILGDADERTVQDIVSVADTVIESLAAEFGTARIDVSTPESTLVRAVPTLEIALKNLIENAIVHNDSDEPWVQVSIEQREQTVVVTIDDDGPGIPKTEHAVVDGSTGTDLEHSTGLGLWLAYWVVDNSAGEIDIERTAIGSRVVVTLPAIEDEYLGDSGTVE